MRAERRKQIEAQMINEKAANKVRRKNSGFFRFMALIFVLTGAGFFYLLFKLDILPMKYMVAAAVVAGLITLFNLPALLSSRGRKGRKVSATVITLLCSAVFCFGIYYLGTTYGFLNSITHEKLPTEEFYVLVRADDLPQITDETTDEERAEMAKRLLSQSTVGAYSSKDPTYAEARVLLKEMLGNDFEFHDTPLDAVNALLEYSHDSILIPVANYEAMKGYGSSGIQNTTGILYTVKVPVQKSGANAVDVSKTTYNVFVSGVDKDGYRSDVNIIVTVNPVTHEVLLTSVPRDSYVILPGKTYDSGNPAYDKLTHAGVYRDDGVLTSAIEETFGITVNYSMTVNYDVVQHLVDAIGGIDVESEYEFTFGEPPYCHFSKGWNHLDGVAALQFARERNAFSDGDMQRNKNQQIVMEAIIKKLTSERTILANYKAILDTVGDDLKTNMSRDEITEIIKAQLGTMPQWTISKHSVEGDIGYDRCYALGGDFASVVYLSDEDINAAIEEIARVTLGEPKTVEQTAEAGQG